MSLINKEQLEKMHRSLVQQREDFLKEANERLAWLNGRVSLIEDMLAPPTTIEENDTWDKEQ